MKLKVRYTPSIVYNYLCTTNKVINNNILDHRDRQRKTHQKTQISILNNLTITL